MVNSVLINTAPNGSYVNRYQWNEIVLYNEQSYMVYYYKKEHWKKLMKEVYPKKNKILRGLIRAFTDTHYIYALSSEVPYAKIGHDRLIKHEIGHILGETGKHTWKPYLNNPSWLFRWRNKFSDGTELRRYKRSVFIDFS